jgi:prepilin-type N-terminal cleavage/methylation domain-containing protein
MLINEKGFSLLELLLVVTILGIITVIAVPWLQKAIGAAENGNAFASLKTVSSTQIDYYSKRNRFARLDELNAETNGSLGTINGSTLKRGVFTLTMNPINPDDAELRDDFQIIATKGATLSDTPCVLSLEASGAITEIFGTNCIDNE